MKNTSVISILSFGIVLIIVGAILKIMKHSQGNTLLAIGLCFELAAIVLFAWNKIKK